MFVSRKARFLKEKKVVDFRPVLLISSFSRNSVKNNQCEFEINKNRLKAWKTETTPVRSRDHLVNFSLGPRNGR
jgi:hypothetical protein